MSDSNGTDPIHMEQVGEDPIDERLDTIANDAVAGETVYPELGDGTDNGPTGGAPKEATPIEWEHDDEAEGIDLGEDVNKPL